MQKITVNDLIKHCNCKLLIGKEDEVINECVINSKQKTKNGTFFGIKGSKNDGSLFYKEAFDNGAKICIISKIYNLDLTGYEDKTVLVSNDVVSTLQALAAFKRKLFKGIVIGITGSVGKTSTKQMLSNVLEKNYKVLKTTGNENSQIGLPLTILRLKDEDVMVLEMGMSKKGEMHNLSMIARPDIAVITNVYDSHIGNLGSRENILKAKLEILDGMNCGHLIINNDNDMLRLVDNVKDNIKVLTYGIENKSNVMPHNIKEEIKTSFSIDDIDGFLIDGNKTLIYNALATYLVSKLLGVSRGMIKEGINNNIGERHRLEIVKLNNNVTIIDDTYNASYYSIKLALQYIKNFDGKKIVVLGDVLELGKETKDTHRKIGKLLNSDFIDQLITIGKYSKYINKQAIKNGLKRKCVKHFKNELKARDYIKEKVDKDTVLLIKGSNALNLINIVEYLKEGLTF